MLTVKVLVEKLARWKASSGLTLNVPVSWDIKEKEI